MLPEFDRQFRPDKNHHPAPSPGVAVCEGCHAIWRDHRWHRGGAEAEAMIQQGAALTQCPGCKAVERKAYDGQVVLSGAFLRDHHDEILGLVHHIEHEVRDGNPIARIAALTESENQVEILTISEFLAERIGKEVRKAYKGELDMRRPERQPFVSVTWVRER